MKIKRQDKLLDQFITSLTTGYRQALREQKEDEEYSEIRAEIEKTIKTANSWRAAYKAEQLMIPLLAGTLLNTVLSRQMLNVDKLGEDIKQYYEEQVEGSETDHDKQAILRQLTQDLQWHYEILRIKQQYIHEAWSLVSCAFIISFFLFFSPSIYSSLESWLRAAGTGGQRSLDIFTAITSGALGASFSMVIGLHARLKGSSLYTLEAMQKKSYVFFRVFTGIGAGLIFFYFLQSGMLEGSIFPEFMLDPTGKGVLVHKDSVSLSLLIIWCFLSGFSEKLLPNILSKTEEQASVRTLEPMI